MRYRLCYKWPDGAVGLDPDDGRHNHEPLVHVFTDAELHDFAKRIANLFIPVGHAWQRDNGAGVVYDILTSEREPDSTDGGSGERTP